MPKVAGHKDEKKWPRIPIFFLTVPLFTPHLLALLLWRGGRPELRLRGGRGIGGVGAGQSRLDKLCPRYSLVQMGIHKE